MKEVATDTAERCNSPRWPAIISEIGGRRFWDTETTTIGAANKLTFFSSFTNHPLASLSSMGFVFPFPGVVYLFSLGKNRICLSISLRTWLLTNPVLHVHTIINKFYFSYKTKPKKKKYIFIYINSLSLFSFLAILQVTVTFFGTLFNAFGVYVASLEFQSLIFFFYCF